MLVRPTTCNPAGGGQGRCAGGGGGGQRGQGAARQDGRGHDGLQEGAGRVRQRHGEGRRVAAHEGAARTAAAEESRSQARGVRGCCVRNNRRHSPEVPADAVGPCPLASADKKAGRLAAEGVVASYIHPGSRLGVLLEVNCETDFVAASEKFNELVNYIAMGIVAGQGVAYVSAEDIPAEVFEREKQIEMAREDLQVTC